MGGRPIRQPRHCRKPAVIGISLRSADQTTDLAAVWGPGYHGSLDLVTGWYRKAADFVGDHQARIGFVSTSSICQGEQVAPLWAPLLNSGFSIDFAHQTFAWTSEATGKAAVHVVIIGFSKRAKPKKTLFHYSDLKGEPTSSIVKNISPYLVEGPRSSSGRVVNRSVLRSPKSDTATNLQTAGTFLSVSRSTASSRLIQPRLSTLRPFVGARELLHDEPRWCLWLTDLDPKDYQAARYYASESLA